MKSVISSTSAAFTGDGVGQVKQITGWIPFCEGVYKQWNTIGKRTVNRFEFIEFLFEDRLSMRFEVSVRPVQPVERKSKDQDGGGERRSYALTSSNFSFCYF